MRASRLADDLAVLAPDRWMTSSRARAGRCTVLGHTTAAMTRSGSSPDGPPFRFGMARRSIDAASRRPRPNARAVPAGAEPRSGPPGPSTRGRDLVHAEDIRRLLGSPRLPCRRVAGQLASAANLLIGGKDRVADTACDGHRLTVGSARWSRASMLAMCRARGRPDELTGAGVATCGADRARRGRWFGRDAGPYSLWPWACQLSGPTGAGTSTKLHPSTPSPSLHLHPGNHRRIPTPDQRFVSGAELPPGRGTADHLAAARSPQLATAGGCRTRLVTARPGPFLASPALRPAVDARRRRPRGLRPGDDRLWPVGA